jgi:hypothetical protein
MSRKRRVTTWRLHDEWESDESGRTSKDLESDAEDLYTGFKLTMKPGGDT